MIVENKFICFLASKLSYQERSNCRAKKTPNWCRRDFDLLLKVWGYCLWHRKSQRWRDELKIQPSRKQLIVAILSYWLCFIFHHHHHHHNMNFFSIAGFITTPHMMNCNMRNQRIVHSHSRNSGFLCLQLACDASN